MSTIINIRGREVLDSRGKPTVEGVVTLEDGTQGTFIVPSGASTGEHEALELRDKNTQRYFGDGVLQAINNISEIIAPELLGREAINQLEIDNLMITLDGTPNKRKLGANAILAVSGAVARASANYLGIPLYRYLGGITGFTLPVPYLNILNGGRHADNQLDVQEFMLMPVKFKSFREALRASVEIYHILKSILKQKKDIISVGDEGGFAPRMSTTEEALKVIIEAVSSSPYKLGESVFLALDVASSEFYKDGKYHFEGKNWNYKDLTYYYEDLTLQYPIISVEDALSENDFAGWEFLTERIGKRVQLVGDDLFVTNPARLKEGISRGIANSVLVKVNQVGTISETLETIKIARDAGYKIIISHRSGETEENFISHLAVATGAQGIKAGAPARGERTLKYNELLRMEEENNLVYTGSKL